MSIPLPGLRGSAALQALAEPQKRVQFGHADLSAYSVFEEAFFHGTRAGRIAARTWRRRGDDTIDHPQPRSSRARPA